MVTTDMDELHDLIKQDYRELYDEIPDDITDQPWKWTSLLEPWTGRLVFGNRTLPPIQ